MNNLPINLFDAVVVVITLVAVVMGFQAGLLRSLATIFGYVAAMPIAVAAAPPLSQRLADPFHVSQASMTWVLLCLIFLLAGIALSAMLRATVSEVVGVRVSLPDRLAGAILGAVRIALLAVMMVLIFDRIIPPSREPAFLAGSRLRPYLSVAGQQGLKTLPPDVIDYIDRLKRERGI
jgi:membrane protein required for colicin V production